MLMRRNIIFTFFIILFVSIYSFGQNSASATFTASVNIVEPISIQTTANMNFASIDARNGGTVILNPDHSRISTGDVQLDNSANVSAATFEVNGQNGYSYNINISQNSFRMVNGTSEIVIRDFNTNSNKSTLNSDSQTINVGATLDIQANQEPGLYTTPTPIEIMVSYN
ncbi:DUF4402 domain-containing protein [Christiangramia sp. SM2212]|uniref:DUF4402 domain-containing protein n=1 Tax=Christiangramia sediminicola TaxID=3073267 RepID=A0ABU1EPS9_9FLAO|nr:DUF4402 domain-containing protein [Christiangramia sp. SM2212]MDR5590218.1 DUF4402 domain-containing protein [Christiangramia sp. SM2212]